MKETKKSVRDNLLKRGWSHHDAYVNIGSDGQTAYGAIKKAPTAISNVNCYAFLLFRMG